MVIISQSIPTLTGGISQQPDSLKRISQCKNLDNAWPSLVEGLMKRPPLEHHGYLEYSPGSGVTGISTNWSTAHDPAIHWVDRDPTERYMIGVNSADPQGARMRAADLVTATASGKVNEKGVKLSKSAYDYLSSSTASSYRFQTIGDVTFVVNRDKTVAMKSKVKAAAKNTALIHVKQSLGSAGEHVRVTFDGVTTAETDGEDADKVAANIVSAITGGDTSVGTFTPDTNTGRCIMSSTHVDTLAAAGITPLVKITSSGAFPTLYYREKVFEKRKGDDKKKIYWNTINYKITANSRLYAFPDVDGDYFTLSMLPRTSSSQRSFLKWYPDSGSTAFDTLTVSLVGTNSPPTGFESCRAQRSGSLIAISHKDGSDFTLSVEDDHGGTIAKVYHKDTGTFAELPEKGLPGMTLDVLGDSSQGLDDYTVEFKATEGEIGVITSGHWEETAEDGLEYEIDARTMPHIFVRKANGDFECMEGGRIHADATRHLDGTLKVALANHTLYPATDFYVIPFTSGEEVEIEASSASCKLEVGARYYVKPSSVTSIAGYQYVELYEEVGLTTQVTGIGVGDTVTISKANPYLNWGERLAGNETTNPTPTFVGKKINDVAYYKNRLVLLSGENAVCSEAGAFSNFWRTTVLTLLDSAPVDLASSHSSVQVLDRALAFGNQLYCGSDKIQLMLGAPEGQPFTSKTAEFRISSALSVSGSTQPSPMGPTMFIPFTRGDYAGLYEYIPDAQVDNRYVHQDVTEHVPALVNGEIKALASLEREGIVVALGTSAANNTLYVYKTYRSSQQVVQAAWGKFTFHDLDIRAIHFYDHELHILGVRQNKWYIDKIGFKSGRKDTGVDFLTYLDRRVKVANSAAVYTSATNTTKFTLPTGYFMHSADPVDIITTEGDRLTVSAVDSASTPTSVTVTGDYSSKDAWIGQKYTMTLEFADQHMREQAGQGQAIIAQGRLQLRRGTIIFDNSNYFKVTVTPLNRTSYTYPYTGMVLGGGTLTVGSLSLEDGKFSFPVHSKNDEVTITITNDSPLPSNLMGAEFESSYAIRSSRA